MIIKPYDFLRPILGIEAQTLQGSFARLSNERSCNVIIGSGIDVVENSRVERELSRAEWRPEQGVFSSGEIQFCNHSKRPALLFATLFVAKEAALKALGIETTNLSYFREVEVTPDKHGNLGLRLHGQSRLVSERLGVHRASIAVTTNARLSGAIVVLES